MYKIYIKKKTRVSVERGILRFMELKCLPAIVGSTMFV